MTIQAYTVSANTIPKFITAVNTLMATLTGKAIKNVEFNADNQQRRIGLALSLTVTTDIAVAPVSSPYTLYAAQGGTPQSAVAAINTYIAGLGAVFVSPIFLQSLSAENATTGDALTFVFSCTDAAQGATNWQLSGSISAASTPTVDTIAALRASTDPYHNVLVLGYYAAGDGGGGDFVWFDGDTTADNGGTIIAPTDPGLDGRWRRNYTGYLHVVWFGVKADGVTDDTAAIQAAIDVFEFGTIQFPRGDMLISDTIKIDRGIRLLGAGPYDNQGNTVLLLADGSDCTMLQTPAAWDTTPGSHATHYMALENITFEGNSDGQTTENDCVQFWGSYIGSYLRNVFINDSYGQGLTIDKQSDLQLDDVWVQGCVTASGYGVDTNASTFGTVYRFGMLNIDHLYVENISIIKGGDPRNVPADRGKGIHLYKVLSVNINELHVEGVTCGVAIEDCSIVRLNNLHGTWMGDTLRDSGLILLLDALTKKLSISSMYLFDNTANCKFVAKATGVTSDWYPDRPVVNAFHYAGAYTAQSDPAGGEDNLCASFFNNFGGVRRIGAAGTIYWALDWDGAGTMSYLEMNSYVTKLVTTANQPALVAKWFWKINSYGNAGDSFELNVPLIISNTRTVADYILKGAIWRQLAAPIDALCYQQIDGDAAGLRYIGLTTYANKAPDRAAVSPGEMWIDFSTAAHDVYIANYVGGTAADFKLVPQAVYANKAPDRGARYIGEVWVDYSVLPHSLYVATGLGGTAADFIFVPQAINANKPPDRGARYIGELWNDYSVSPHRVYFGTALGGTAADFIQLATMP